MAGKKDRDSTASDEPSGQVDSDDTTQADAGMAAGTGGAEGQATATPMGTAPPSDDEAGSG